MHFYTFNLANFNLKLIKVNQLLNCICKKAECPFKRNWLIFYWGKNTITDGRALTEN